MMPHCIQKSLHWEPSPAMLPRAHTAWSTTFWWWLERRRTNKGTAPRERERERKRAIAIKQ